MTKKETYQVTAECTNCGHTPKRTTPEGKAIEPFKYSIPTGTTAHEYFGGMICPNCGCTGRLKRKFS